MDDNDQGIRRETVLAERPESLTDAYDAVTFFPIMLYDLKVYLGSEQSRSSSFRLTQPEISGGRLPP